MAKVKVFVYRRRRHRRRRGYDNSSPDFRHGELKSTIRYKYTWAPQTVHNTPVMNILKAYFYLILFYKKLIKETNVKF